MALDGKVIVIGSAVVDRTFRVEALPLPGESTLASEVHVTLGGKGANQAAAAARLGAPTVFVGRVGDDEGGRDTARDLQSLGVETHVAVAPDAPTGHATVVVDEDGENQITLHLGANAHVAPEDWAGVADALAGAAVLVAQLEIPLETVRAAAEVKRSNPESLAILNAAPVREGLRDLLPLFDIAVLNRGEAEAVAEVGIANLDDALAALRGIAGLGVVMPVITLGAAGAVFLEHGRGVHVRAPAVETVDATGSGDAFVGALATLLREGLETKDAMEGACHYAARAATALGARAAYLDRQAFDAEWPAP